MNELVVLVFLFLGIYGLRRAWRERRRGITIVSVVLIAISVVYAISTGAFQPN